jgi:SAM-dependent methyltransferase
MNACTEFWNALAQFHAEIEDTNFDLKSVRRILPEIKSPVLVIGAGHGLIVAELRSRGFDCDGVDLSAAMIAQAKSRRNITLTQADAAALPFLASSYRTVIYATGVIDFTAADETIRAILREGRRVTQDAGHIFVAFYRASPAQEKFLTAAGLLSEGMVALRESFGLSLLNPLQMVGWIAKRTGVTRFHAALVILHLTAFSSIQEKRTTLRMQRLFRKMANPSHLISVAPEKVPYRNEREIEALFKRLNIPLKQLRTLASCWVVRI